MFNYLHFDFPFRISDPINKTSERDPAEPCLAVSSKQGREQLRLCPLFWLHIDTNLGRTSMQCDTALSVLQDPTRISEGVFLIWQVLKKFYILDQSLINSSIDQIVLKSVGNMECLDTDSTLYLESSYYQIDDQ